MTDTRPTLLLVDDDSSILVMLEKSLTPGYDVLTATDADQAIDLFRVGGDAIELVLRDLGMRGMSSYETQAKLFRPAQVVVAVQGLIGM